MRKASLLSMALLVFVAGLSASQPAFSATYEDSSWWFENAGQIAGNMAITITYPDRLAIGDDLDVAVNLEYIDNENARSNYVVFSDVQIHIRDPLLRFGQDLVKSERITFPFLKPGEQYSQVFTIPMPAVESLVGQQAVPDLSFTAFFSRSTTLESYQWDSGANYNAGKISDEQLPALTIVNQDDLAKNIVIRIKQPYDRISPVNATVDGISYSVPVGGLQLSLASDSNHTVTLPQHIRFPSNGIRAIFVNWSDGYPSETESGNIEREVILTKDKELFAIYKTQYLLQINSDIDSNPNGRGWHDSGSQTSLSVNPFAGILMLNTFERWSGDFEGNDAYSTLIMDTPKTVNAHWKFDLAILGGTAGVIASIISLAKLLPPAIRKFRK